MKIIPIIVSNEDWNSQEFAVVIQQVKDSVRKISKGIDVGLERKRFTNACNRIEALSIKGCKGKLEITENKLQEMLNSLLSDSGALFPFIEPDNLKFYNKYLDANKLRNLTDLKSALVFILDEYGKGNITLKPQKPNDLNINIVKSNVNEFYKIPPENIDQIQARFHKQILDAVQNETPIGWLNVAESDEESNDSPQTLLRHEGIITCLREHIFVNKQPTQIVNVRKKKTVIDSEANEIRRKKWWFPIVNFFFKLKDKTKQITVEEPTVVPVEIIPRNIQFAFSDGSISDFFPLYSLLNINPPANLPTVKAALISNRHFELDSIVDVCILRNSEISRRQETTYADQEKLSFNIAYKFFNEIITKTKGIHIELYHTGLEPAVIGTYRALLAVLIKKENRGKIIVTPKIFTGNNQYKDLKVWY